MEYKDLSNYHALKVTFKNNGHPHTIITSQRFPRNTKVLAYDYLASSTAEQAFNYLTKHGFEIVGKAEIPHGTMLFSTTFEKL